MSNIIFKIHDIECGYGSHQVLQGINYQVPPGSFLGIIGPNAAGKSTLLKAITKALKPMRGVVYFQGENLNEISRRDLAKQVAVVPQETEVNFPFTVSEVVMMGRHPHLGRFDQESKRDYAIVRQAMESANCWHLRDRNALELSGGESQKVILARALAQEPKIILLDEPVSHLDLSAQLEVLNLLKEMNNNHGVTVIGILHDLNLASQFSKQLIMLKEGKIFKAGTPKEVLTVENIKKVYNTDVLVIKHPLTGVPQIVVLPVASDDRVSFSQLRVHLICGGGMGGALMGQLSRMGCGVSAGVVNIQDTDWEVGRSLKLELVEEKPFSSISTSSYEANLQMALQADAIFVLETPFGQGNILNAQILKPLLAHGKSCYFVDAEHLPERDYTGGDVVRCISMLKEQGLQLLPDQLSVLKVVQNIREGKSDGKTALG